MQNVSYSKKNKPTLHVSRGKDLDGQYSQSRFIILTFKKILKNRIKSKRKKNSWQTLMMHTSPLYRTPHFYIALHHSIISRTSQLHFLPYISTFSLVQKNPFRSKNYKLKLFKSKLKLNHNFRNFENYQQHKKKSSL